MIKILKKWFAPNTPDPLSASAAQGLRPPAVRHVDQQAQFDHDLSLLESEAGEQGVQVQRQAEKEVRSAAADSLRKLHVIQRGHCPQCGETLRRHLFASVCDACGWHTFESPRRGPVRAHLVNSNEVVEGEHAYVVKTGAVLVLRNDVVVARLPANSVSWLEYIWEPDEVEQRHRQVVEQMELRCGWCEGPADPESDGFHLAQTAFGATQERYCFCSDNCYEEFRRMYPARVHRNCYERNCADCNLCSKRYSDEAEGIRMLGKDYLRPRSEKKKG